MQPVALLAWLCISSHVVDVTAFDATPPKKSPSALLASLDAVSTK